jgi:two-component system response regulator HydG
MVTLAAKNRHHAIIIGEPGVGKVTVARAIHETTGTGTILAMDCTDPFLSLVHRELFGHRRRDGAWIEGALLQRDATVVLRSVPDLPIFLQRRLAAALRSGFLPAEPAPFEVHARVFATVHWREELVESVSSELKVELSRFVLDVPALRERSEDIPAIAGAIAEELGCEISEDATSVLVEYRWPGNMRELHSCLQRAAQLGNTTVIEASDLPEEIRGKAGERRLERHGSSVRTIADVERDAIVKAMAASKGNKVEAAKLLGIGKTTLYRKIREYQLGESLS